MHAIYIDGAREPTIIQPDDYTWRPKKLTYPWVVVDDLTGDVVERYIPPKGARRIRELFSPHRQKQLDRVRKRSVKFATP